MLNNNVLSNIVVGQNLIAGVATDCGGTKGFGMYMDVVTIAAVPAMSPTVLLMLTVVLIVTAVATIKKRSFGRPA